MDLLDNSKFVCNCCNWNGLGQERLIAANPFDTTDVVIGCPKCKSIGSFFSSCDEKDCWQEASCGTPVKDKGDGVIYRRVCGEHYREILKEEEK